MLSLLFVLHIISRVPLRVRGTLMFDLEQSKQGPPGVLQVRGTLMFDLEQSKQGPPGVPQVSGTLMPNLFLLCNR